MALQAWGQLPAAPAAQELRWADRDADLPETGSSLLAYGNGRSYGDVCLNSGATLLHTRSMDRFIDFDEASGTLICEAGVLLADILALFVPRGWFLPVTPGTRFVTLGGAIANDVHGKNHHAAGSFGRHIRRFELLRSDGERRVCSPAENPELFAATVGGLGLTGLITWVEISLKPVAGPMISVENTRFNGLDEFFAINAAYAPFFHPLDGVLHWNRIYGKQGFYQYQFVLPFAARAALDDILRSIASSGQGSFLAVLKTFGNLPSPGLLSFPMPGVSLALDFPNRGAVTRALFDRLDAIVVAAGGRLYAAKDARMSGEFRRILHGVFSCKVDGDEDKGDDLCTGF